LLDALVGGLFGSPLFTANPLTLLIWVVGWVGLGIVCSLLGNVWDFVSPLSASGRALSAPLAGPSFDTGISAAASAAATRGGNTCFPRLMASPPLHQGLSNPGFGRLRRKSVLGPIDAAGERRVTLPFDAWFDVAAIDPHAGRTKKVQCDCCSGIDATHALTVRPDAYPTMSLTPVVHSPSRCVSTALLLDCKAQARDLRAGQG
jgi:hypothetical protein